MLEIFRNQFQAFLMALLFYTRFPVSRWVGFSESLQKRSIVYLPIVGWVVGGYAALLFFLSFLILPLSVSVLISMIGTLHITGAFHEDGWADICDGFGGGWSKEQVLTIMKDSRLGTFGVIGLCSVLALKFVTLWEIGPSWIVLTLIAGHSLSRAAAATLMALLPYVGQDSSSKVKPLIKPLTVQEAILINILGVLPLVLLMPQFWTAVVVLLGVSGGMGWYFHKRIGGYTGDCLGGVQQISEVVFYLWVLGSLSCL